MPKKTKKRNMLTNNAEFMFIQKGDWFNPMQFAVCASFITNIFAALFMYEVFKKNRAIGIGLGIVVFVLTFVPNIVNLGYLSNPARYVIPQREMVALDFLKKQPDGIVFVPIFEPDLAYVSAFTGKQTYINFTNVLENTGIDFRKRLDRVKDPKTIQVDALNISYAYIPSAYKEHKILIMRFNQSSAYKQIYTNDAAVIFKKTQ